jgi:hypothetical protein
MVRLRRLCSQRTRSNFRPPWLAQLTMAAPESQPDRRLLEPIGNLPPAEAEAAYYAQLEVTRIAA